MLWPLRVTPRIALRHKLLVPLLGMALLCIQVPSKIAHSLGEIQVPGTIVPDREKHISLVFIEEGAPIETLSKVIIASYKVATQTQPFSVGVSELTCFPDGPDGVPVIAKVQSPELHAFRKALCRGLDQAKVEYSKVYKEYKPHVTLSYSTSPVKSSEVGPFKWTIKEITLWGDDGGFSCTFALATRRKEALFRALVQSRLCYAR